MKQKLTAVAFVSAILLIANICVAPSVMESYTTPGVQVGYIFDNLSTGV